MATDITSGPPGPGSALVTAAPAPTTAARTPSPPASPPPAGAGGRVRSDVTPVVRVASEWTWRLLVIAVGVLALCRLLAEFSEILIPVLVSLLLAALLHPVVERLARFLPHALAAITTLLLAILLVVGLFALVGQQAVSGFADLRDQALDGIAQVQNWLSTGPLHLSTTALSEYVDKARTTVEENRSTIVSGALGVASTVTHLAEGFFITLFATFFFLSSGQRIWAWLLRILPSAAQHPLDEAGRSGWVTLSHYVRATLIVAVVDGVGVGVGAALLGVPLAVPLGVVVFLGAFIPVVGALLSGVVAILVALVAEGPVIALAMLGVVLLVQQVEAHGLQPFLLGRAVAVHPLAVILAIATGAVIAGVVGALFAVPIVAVANTMITSLAGRSRTDPGEEVSEDDAPLAPDLPPPTVVDSEADKAPAGA